MALLEATNTLLDFDACPNSLDFFTSPFLADFSSRSPALWNGSSDDERNVTSLANTSLDHPEVAPTQPCADPLLTTDFSLVSSPSVNSLEDTRFGDNNQTGRSTGGDTSECTSPEHENHSSKRPKRRTEKTCRRHRATRANNNLPPCRICADAASGFHYGVNSCEACKRFFRRALKRKRDFRCKGNKNCTIQGKKNSICGYCRYTRCLALGMSKTAIRTGRYTHEKRAQDNREVESLDSDHSTVTIPEAEVAGIMQRLITAHASVITSAHVPREVMVRRALETLEEFQLKKEMFGFQDTLTSEQYDDVFRVTGLDVDERQKDMEFVAKDIDVFVHSYVHFGKRVPGFDSLSLKDQTNLLKLSRVEVWFLGAYLGFMKDLNIFYAPNSATRHRIEMNRLLGKDYTDCAFDLAQRLQKLNLSFEEVVVLKAVCLTFADRCDMDDATKVEEIQWRMLRCFLHLLNKNHPDDPNLFYKVMNWMVAVRNLTELSRKALANTHFTDAIRNNTTLIDLIIL